MEITRTATVVAVEMCELYRLNRQDFRAAIAPYPDLLHKIETTALSRYHVTQEHERMSISLPSTSRDKKERN